MSMVYEKWGTRIADLDEGNERLLGFAFSAAKATAEDRSWELLPGPVERVPVGWFDGERIFAYLWPVGKEGGA